MKASHAARDNLIKQTHKVWQTRIQRNLTNEDARRITENVTGFFAILAEWSRVATPASANFATVADPTETLDVSHDC